jgi:tetratricopeptide (TPR) repeat protein
MIALLFLFLTDSPHIKTAAEAYRQGHVALLKKQPDSAIKLLSRAIEIEPTFIEAYRDLIEANLAAGDRLKAAAAMTRLLEIEPHAFEYRLQLAQILLAEKQLDRSLAQFSLVLEDAPFNADALWGFSAAATSLGMKDRAAQALATGHARYPLDKRFSAP